MTDNGRTRMTEEFDLLPCPFCGGAAERRQNELLGDMSMVSCSSCGAEAYDKKWNRRVAAPVPPILEKLPVAFEVLDTEEGAYLTRSEPAARNSGFEYNGLYRRASAPVPPAIGDMEPLGREFEEVWDANVETLYEAAPVPDDPYLAATPASAVERYREALQIASNACNDVVALGRFSNSVDPVRWVEQLKAHIDQALAAAPASAAEPLSKADVLQACLLLERACAYAGDAIPASILSDAQDLHARLSLTIETP